MLDRPQPAESQRPHADTAENIPAGAMAPRAQLAAADDSVSTSSFDGAAVAAGLDGNLLSTELAQLMEVPVLPEPVSGGASTGEAGDPHLLLSMLAGLSLSDLMNLSVDSGLGLLQELDALHAQDGAIPPSNPFAAEFLHNMMSLPLPDLMSVGPLQNLFLTDYAHHPGHFDFVWGLDRPEAAGALASEDVTSSDHHAEQPVAIGDNLPVLPPALFTSRDDTVIFDSMTAGHHAAGSLHDALGGDDYVVLPSSAAVADALGYDAAQTFTGGAGNDTIVSGGLADAIDGGSGIDAVSYAGSGPIIVLLQDTDTHGPHANEPAGGSGGLAEGDSYTSIETLIASPFDDYVFGGAAGGSVYLMGGNDVFDNTETQAVPDYVDGGAGNDTMWGGGGTDTLIGGTGNDQLFGENGNDLLDGGGGVDRLSGGNGDDTLVWSGAAALLAGDAGTDTLRVGGGNINLGSLAGIASGIERIDIATDTAANAVTLAAADVLNFSSTHTLAIVGTTGDSVAAGNGWTDAGLDGAGSHVFTKLSGGVLATLVVSQDVTVNADITT